MRGRAQHGPSRRGGGGAQDSSGKKKKQHEHHAVGISCSIVPCAQNPHMSDDQKPARRSKSSPERRSEADLARHSTATLRGGWSGPPARRATAETRARTQAACAPVSAKTPPLFHVAYLTWSELTFQQLCERRSRAQRRFCTSTTSRPQASEFACQLCVRAYMRDWSMT